ncbi:MAG: BRCT domain-containing protein [Planctomycetota bacterium]
MKRFWLWGLAFLFLAGPSWAQEGEVELRKRIEELENENHALRDKNQQSRRIIAKLQEHLLKLKNEMDRVTRSQSHGEDACRRLKEDLEDLRFLLRHRERSSGPGSRLERESDKIRREIEKTGKAPLPDGRIADIDGGGTRVTIDLGSRHGVKHGMRFIVFSMVEGGGWREKGLIRVLQVGEKECTSIVVRRENETDSIAKGDYIWNRFFKRGDQLVFLFAGRFPGNGEGYTRDQLKKIIEEAGHVVAEDFRKEIRYVILGEDYRKDRGYLFAMERKLKTLTPAEVIQMLGKMK